MPYEQLIKFCDLLANFEKIQIQYLHHLKVALSLSVVMCRSYEGEENMNMPLIGTFALPTDYIQGRYRTKRSSCQWTQCCPSFSEKEHKCLQGAVGIYKGEQKASSKGIIR